MKIFFINQKLVVILVIGLLTISCLSYGGDKKQPLRSVKAPPELFVPTDLFPSNGKYESAPGSNISWPMGISLRYLSERQFSQFDSLPALGASWKMYNFNATAGYEISFNGGMTWNFGTSPAFNSVRLNHVADTGETRYFDAEILGLNISGGSLPTGTLIRESPTLPSPGKVKVTDGGGGRYTIESFFDILLEISTDAGMSWWPAPGTLNFIFSYYPIESFFISDIFPPSTSIYLSEPGKSIIFSPGIMIRNIVKRNPNASIVPPPPGPPVIHVYNDEILFQISLDMGGSWTDAKAPCTNITQLSFTIPDGATILYAAEHLSMDISGGTIPGDLLIRESPTLASTGQYTTRVNALGYMINSFFDIFLELSFDGGLSWYPADRTMTLELSVCPTITIEPATLPAGQIDNEYSQTLVASGGTPPYTFSIQSGSLPPDLTLTPDGLLSGPVSDYGFFSFTVIAEDHNHCEGLQSYTMTIYPPENLCGSDAFPPYGRYVNKPGDIIYYPMGIAIRNMILRTMRPFDTIPDMGSKKAFPFTGILTFDISFNQGATWTYNEIKTENTISLDHTADSALKSFFDLEVLQMDISGGPLPFGVMIRESPTQASPGRLTIGSGGGSYTCDSFFDIFTEISLDGGQMWMPAVNDIYMILKHMPITLTNTDYFPPAGIYKSIKIETLFMPGGIALRNFKHYNFIPTGAPPKLGKTKLFNYTGMVEFELSFDNGLTWMNMQASSTNTSNLDHFGDDDSMNFYDAEMMQFDIAGGTLPPGVLIRENPAQTSVGEFNAKYKSTDSWWVDSFFDIYFDISLDGGMTWAQAIKPLELILSESSLEIDVATNWNMVSIPLIVSDPRKTELFENAISPAYTFEGIYVEKDTLENGIGYWIKYRGSETVSISGQSIFEQAIKVIEGWNMIGSISLPVDVTSITSIPEGIITSEFFEYNTAYNPTDTIRPGKAYWVKVSESGKLILSIYDAAMPAAGKINIVPISELPPAPPDDRRNTRLQSLLPSKSQLHQNSPNPFNPSTIIKYDLSENARVTLKVYNIFGQEVMTLVDGFQEAGYKSIELNTGTLASGIYFYRLTTGNFTDTKKMIFCK